MRLSAVWGSVQILMDGDIYDQFSPSQNIAPRSDVLKTLAPSLALFRAHYSRSVSRGQSSVNADNFIQWLWCGGRRPEWKEGMCSHLSQPVTHSLRHSVLSKARREHYTEQIPFSGWLVGCLQARNAQATSNLSCSRSRGITCED